MQQNYCIVNTETIPNYCENVVNWDGDVNNWSPPSGTIALLQAETPSRDWSFDANSNTYILVDSIGRGSIGWTWNGKILVTNRPQPNPVEETQT